MLLWFDGFDQYGDSGGQLSVLPSEGLWADFFQVLTQKDDTYQAHFGFSVAARTGGFWAANGSCRRSLNGDKTTVGCGTGFYMGNLPESASYEIAVMQFRDLNNKCQIHVSIGTTGRIVVTRGGFDGRLTPSGSNVAGGAPGVIATSTLELAPGTWNHIETKVVFDTANGSVRVIVNGRQTYIDVSGINTTSNEADFTTCSQVAFGKFDSFIATPIDLTGWDDIFVWDDDVSGLHDFLGQYGVYSLSPNSDSGSHHDWSLTSGAHGYALINDIPPDDDTDFIFTGVVNDRSDFGVLPLPANITLVAGVMPCGRLRKTDTGDADVELGVVSGGTTSYSGDTPIMTSWTYFEPLVLEKDPNTSAAWGPTAVNAALLTVKRTV